DADFLTLAKSFEKLLTSKGYARVETIRDEGVPLRFYAVRHWTSIEAAERCHADHDVQILMTKLYQIARVTHVVNGIRLPDHMRALLDERRARTADGRGRGV